MANELKYIYSKNRVKRYQQFENSKKRRARYKVNPEDYSITDETLKKYPIELVNQVIFLKLEDLMDTNIGLKCGLVARTDNIVEYEYYPDDDGGNTGRYVRKERPRSGTEIYQLFAVT